MSNWVQLSDGRKVRQTSGDVEVVYPDGSSIVGHYGELGKEVDKAARDSLSFIEYAADLERERQKL